MFLCELPQGPGHYPPSCSPSVWQVSVLRGNPLPSGLSFLLLDHELCRRRAGCGSAPELWAGKPVLYLASLGLQGVETHLGKHQGCDGVAHTHHGQLLHITLAPRALV